MWIENRILQSQETSVSTCRSSRVGSWERFENARRATPFSEMMLSGQGSDFNIATIIEAIAVNIIITIFPTLIEHLLYQAQFNAVCIYTFNYHKTSKRDGTIVMLTFQRAESRH